MATGEEGVGGREVGGCDLSEAHAVGLLPDLCQPQPLLHLAVPGAGQGVSGEGGASALPARMVPSPPRPAPPVPGPPPAAASLLALPVKGRRQRLHLLHGRRLLPLVELALDLVLQLIAHLGRTGWGLAAAPTGLACPPAAAPLRSVRGTPWRPPHPRIPPGSSFRKDPNRPPSAPLRSQALPKVHRLDVTPPSRQLCPPRGPLGSSLGLVLTVPLLRTPSPSVQGTCLLPVCRSTLNPHLLRAALPAFQVHQSKLPQHLHAPLPPASTQHPGRPAH